jgi:fatty-acyl-CoA synthase
MEKNRNIQQYLSSQFILGEMPVKWARKTPEKEAFVHNENRCTYLQFNERINKLANGLTELGIRKGDKVAVLFLNCIEIVECYFAVSKLGAVVVPLNFRLVARELTYQIEHSDSAVLIFGEQYVKTINSIKQNIPNVEEYICVCQKSPPGIRSYEDFLQAQSADDPLVAVSDDDPAFIMYTSGTTGKPKGVVLTHKNLLANVFNNWIELRGSSDERLLCIPPIFHVGATANILKTVFLGGTCILRDQFIPDEIPRIIEEEKITFLLLISSMWISFLQVPEIKKYDMSPLRIGLTGGAVIPTEVKKNILKEFPNLQLSDNFGQTEMSGGATLLKCEDMLRKPGSVGKPFYNVEVRIVDKDDNDVPVGDVGEIVFRGTTVMKEYYKNPIETANTMRGGWLHSGDLVRADDEGYIYVEGRSKDMIISGGENIYPAEVEDVLYTHPDILEAAVVGMPDAKWGESVKAFVVLKEDRKLTEVEIIEHCRKNLAGYKKPKFIDFMDALPKNATGKILKYKLKEN